MEHRLSNFDVCHNERGTVLILAILMLLLLTLIGIFATNTSTLDILISGNYKTSKATFHQADGGTQVGIELLEQNIYSAGFDTDDIGNIHIEDRNLYLNSSSGSRVAYFPKNSNGSIPPFTELKISGNSSLSTGTAIQLARGYEGKGKGAASGGVYVVYDIESHHNGIGNSHATVKLRYRFVP